jgi:putative ABC transport system ATP-binding protein
MTKAKLFLTQHDKLMSFSYEKGGIDMPIIQINQVTKDYPLGNTTVHALRGIDLKIDEGAFMSIVGPSGSGKTTLLNIIGCIDHATSGQVILEGHDLSTLSDDQRTDLRLHNIGFIFQAFNLIPVLNTIENVEFPLLLKGQDSATAIRQKAESLLEKVGLKNHMNHRPSELSGGQRQRVAIARALVTQPKLVLADEPTANLDSETGQTILALMQELNQKEKVTFVFSTHDPDVLQYARQIVKIRDGHLIS